MRVSMNTEVENTTTALVVAPKIWIIAIQNPWDFRDFKEYWIEPRADLTIDDCIREYYPKVLRDTDVVCSIDGEIVEDLSTLVRSGQNVVFTLVPHSGDDGKDIVRIVAMIAVMVVALYTGQVWAGGWAVKAFGVAEGSFLASAAFGTALAATAGTLIVNAVLPPSISDIPSLSYDPGENSPTYQSYGWSNQRNPMQEGAPWPIPWGKTRVVPPVLSNYISIQDNKQYLNVLYGIADCIVDNIGNVEANGTPIEEFDGVQLEYCFGKSPVIDANLEIWLAFDDARGDVAIDWSGNNRHGELLNMGDENWIVNGKSRGCLHFNSDIVGTGTGNEAVQVAHHADIAFTTESFFISLWFRQTSLNQGSNNRLVSKGLFQTSGYEVFHTGGSGIEFRVYTLGADYGAYFAISNDLLWHHLIVSKDNYGTYGFTNQAPTDCCTDPDNDTDATTGWVAGHSILASISGGAKKSDGSEGYCLEITENGAATYAYAYKNITSGVVAGDTWIYKGKVKAGTEKTYDVSIYDVTNGAYIWLPGSFEDTAGDWSTSWNHSFTIPALCTQIRIYVGQKTSIATDTTMFFDDIWCSRYALQARGWIDGAEIANTGAYPVDPAANTDPLYVGHYQGGPTGQYGFRGLIDEVRVYSRAATQEDADILFGIPAGPYELDQAVISNFEDQREDQSIGLQIPTDGSYTVTKQTLGNSVTGLVVGITLPSGLYYANDEGGLSNATVDVIVEYQEVGGSGWTVIGPQHSEYRKIKEGAGFTVSGNPQVITLPFTHNFNSNHTYAIRTTQNQWFQRFDTGILEINNPGNVTTNTVTLAATYSHPFWAPLQNKVSLYEWEESTGYSKITAAKRNTLRYTFEITGLTADQYEVRVKFNSAPPSGSRYSNTAYFDFLQEIVEQPFSYPGASLLSIKALATEKLNGQMPVVTCEVDRRNVMVYDEDLSIWRQMPAKNPAWRAYDCYVNGTPGELWKDNAKLTTYWDGNYGARRPVAEIDYDEFEDWATECDSLGAEVHHYADTEQSFDQMVGHSEILGRGKTVYRGDKYGVIIDRADTPAQQFTVGNVSKSSFETGWLADDERIDILIAKFWDKTKEYIPDRVQYTNPDYDPDEATKQANERTVTLYGCVDRDTALNWVVFQMNYNRLCTRTAKWAADVEAIRAQPGDPVMVSHDVPHPDNWGYSGRISSYTEYTVTIDRQVTLEVGKSYQIVITQRDTDTIETLVVTDKDATTNVLDVAAGLARWGESDVYDNAVYAFGEVNFVYKTFRIVGASRDQESKIRLHGLEYDEDIYTTLTVIEFDDCEDDETVYYSAGDCTIEHVLDGGNGAEGSDGYYKVTETAASQGIYRSMAGLTVGELYDFIVVLKNGTHEFGSGSSPDILKVESPSGTIVKSTEIKSSDDWTEYSVQWKARTTDSDIVFIYTYMGTGDDYKFDNWKIRKALQPVLTEPTYSYVRNVQIQEIFYSEQDVQKASLMLTWRGEALSWFVFYREKNKTAEWTLYSQVYQQSALLEGLDRNPEVLTFDDCEDDDLGGGVGAYNFTDCTVVFTSDAGNGANGSDGYYTMTYAAATQHLTFFPHLWFGPLTIGKQYTFSVFLKNGTWSLSTGVDYIQACNNARTVTIESQTVEDSPQWRKFSVTWTATEINNAVRVSINMTAGGENVKIDNLRITEAGKSYEFNISPTSDPSLGVTVSEDEYIGLPTSVPAPTNLEWSDREITVKTAEQPIYAVDLEWVESIEVNCRYVVEWKKNTDKVWVVEPSIRGNKHTLLNLVHSTAYDFRVKAIHRTGIESAYLENLNNTIDTYSDDPPTVTGLTLQTGSGSNWEGDDLMMSWDDVGSDAKYRFDKYRVIVKTVPAGTPIRTVYTKKPEYLYTKAQNAYDNSGTPRYAIRYAVACVNRQNEVGTEQGLDVTHVSLSNVSGLSGSSILGGVLFLWNEDTDIAFKEFQVRTDVVTPLTTSWESVGKANTHLRILSDSERESYGKNATIYIEVKSKDIFGRETSAQSANANAADAEPTFPFDDDLIGHWSFDEGGGSVVGDRSANGNHATFQGSLGENDWKQGVSGYCVDFGGTDEWVTTEAISLSGNITISGWVNVDSFVQRAGFGFYAWNGGSSGTGFMITPSALNTVRLVIGRTGLDYLSVDFTAGVVLTTGEWYHLAVVYNSSSTTFTVYLNGKNIGSVVQAAVFDGSGDIFQFGRWANDYNSYYFDGKQDEIRAYSAALTANQVQALFQSPGGGKPANVIPPFPTDEDIYGYWSFDEGNGLIATDYSGQGHHGKLEGNAVYTTGLFGKCLTVPNQDGDVDIGLAAITGARTVSAWIWVDDSAWDGSPATNYEIISDENYQVVGWLIRINESSGLPYVRFNTAGAHTQLQATTVLTPQSWHHIAFTYDGTTGHIYIDGVLDNSGLMTDNVAGTTNTQIGGNSQQFKGKIDDFRLYQRALTSGEIKALFLYQKQSSVDFRLPSDQNLIGLWSMDEGTGDVTADESSSGANGTLNNTPTWADGVAGKCLQFDSVADEYVGISYTDLPDLDISDKFSISLWLRPESSPSHGNTRAFSMRDADGWTLVVFIENHGTTPKVGLWVHDGVAYTRWRVGVIDAIDLDGDFSHVVFTYNAGTVHCYINGDEKETSDAGITGNSSVYGIACYDGSAYHFHGKLDEIRLYKTDISEAESKALYLSPGGGKIIRRTPVPFVTASNGIFWSRAKHAGAWTPAGTTTDLDFTWEEGGLEVCRDAKRITINTSDGTLTASDTTHKDGDLSTATWSIAGDGTTAVSITGTYNGVSITRTVASSQGGDQGDQGVQGDTGADGVDASGALNFKYSTTTTMGDPGSGYFRLNNAAMGSVTEMAIDDADKDAVDVSAMIAAWDDSTSLDFKGLLSIVDKADPSKYAWFKIDADNNDQTGYTRVQLEYVDHNGAFLNNDELVITFTPSGDRGGSAFFIVDPGGGADYTTLEGAITAVTSDTVIFLRNATHTAPASVLTLPSYNVSIIGETQIGSVLQTSTNTGLFTKIDGPAKVYRFSDFTISSPAASAYTYLFNINKSTGTNDIKGMYFTRISVTTADTTRYHYFAYLYNFNDSESIVRVSKCTFTNLYQAVRKSTSEGGFQFFTNRITTTRYPLLMIDIKGSVEISQHNYIENPEGGTKYAIRSQNNYTSSLKILNNIFVHPAGTNLSSGNITMISISHTGSGPDYVEISGNDIDVDDTYSSDPSASITGIYCYSDQIRVVNNEITIHTVYRSITGLHVVTSNHGMFANNIFYLDVDNTGKNVRGIYASSCDNNNFDNNNFDLVNNRATDIVIDLTATCDNNYGTNNVAFNWGVGVQDAGTGNTVTIAKGT